MSGLDEPLCPFCDGCPVCAVDPDCCDDCTGNLEEGDIFCECEGHFCGPQPDDVEPEEPPDDEARP